MNDNVSKKITREHTLKYTDIDTGEMITVASITTSKIEQEPDFVKIYLNDLVKLKNLPNSCNSLLYEIIKLMSYNNMVILNAWVKNEIAKAMKTTINCLEHGLTKLIKEGIITRIATGTYFVNPDLFGKGKWTDIRNLRLTIKYDDVGRTFSVERNVPKEVGKEQFNEIVSAIDHSPHNSNHAGNED